MPTAVARAETDPSRPSPRVLLVGESTEERELYAQAFRLEGYCTLLASSNEEACRLAADLPPSAVIVDVGLWGWKDGVTLIRTMKADGRLRQVPTVILTARSLSGDREVAARAGCDLFVAKPCVPEALARLVSGLVNRPLFA